MYTIKLTPALLILCSRMPWMFPFDSYQRKQAPIAYYYLPFYFTGEGHLYYLNKDEAFYHYLGVCESYKMLRYEIFSYEEICRLSPPSSMARCHDLHQKWRNRFRWKIVGTSGLIKRRAYKGLIAWLDFPTIYYYYCTG